MSPVYGLDPAEERGAGVKIGVHEHDLRSVISVQSPDSSTTFDICDRVHLLA